MKYDRENIGGRIGWIKIEKHIIYDRKKRGKLHLL